MSVTVRLYMSMCLDGFIAGRDDRLGQELGRGGRLFKWLDGINPQVYGEALATGAVIAGRRTFELAGRWVTTTTVMVTADGRSSAGPAPYDYRKG